jgi:hypothetical protein
MSTDFWTRFGLQEQDRGRCVDAVRETYTGCEVQEFEEQGGCSFTLLVSRSRDSDNDDGVSIKELNINSVSYILQFRPAQYALDLRIAAVAKELYPALAPSIRALSLDLPGSLRAYEMQRMPGTPLSRLLPPSQVLDAATQQKHERLVTSLASLIAASYAPPKPLRHTRADSPISDTPTILSHCPGKVGSSMMHRLGKLSEELPSMELRRRTRDTLAKLKNVEAYPVVLNHGDLIPSNILVDPSTWSITGLVDWAEAEFLPFGTSLYSLDFLLGHPHTSSSLTPQFVYFENAARLREVFWRALFDQAPELGKRRGDVEMMRDVGVLLWFGFAWDEGRIDRVVEEERDGMEVVCLRAFLGVG